MTSLDSHKPTNRSHLRAVINNPLQEKSASTEVRFDLLSEKKKAEVLSILHNLDQGSRQLNASATIQQTSYARQREDKMLFDDGRFSRVVDELSSQAAIQFEQLIAEHRASNQSEIRVIYWLIGVSVITLGCILSCFI